MSEQNAGQRDWGNLRFSRRQRQSDGGGEAPAQTRFFIGLGIFLLVALIYPWYEYRIQSRLAAKDIEAAAKALQKEFGAQSARLEAELDAAAARQVAPDARYDTARSIRIHGVMETSAGPLAIVDLAGRSLNDARSVICLRVQESLGTSTIGRKVKVQRYRRNRPSITIGTVRC